MGRKLALDVIDIKEPCSEDWGKMTGDDKARFCGLCHRDVYNLTAMSREEAEALLDTPERVCVRFVRRADGTVTTADCTPDRLAALRRGAKRSLAWAGAALAGLLTVVGGLGFSGLGVEAVEGLVDELTEPEPCEVMGEAPYIEPPPETTVEPETATPEPTTLIEEG